MSCYLNLSRRFELVIARSAGVSAWQFITPALLVALIIGSLADGALQSGGGHPARAVETPRGRTFRPDQGGFGGSGGPFWASQRDETGSAIINAKSSRDQGAELSGVTVFTFDHEGAFKQRIEARAAVLHPGVWHLLDARVVELGAKPVNQAVYRLKTSLTPEQARESFATPETVPFWELPAYITIAEHAGLVAAGYRLQFQKLIARPFLLAAMVFLAAAVSLRFFRFGGVQKMILSGVAAGFLLYVLSKVTEDLSKADLLHPVAAAWLPVLVGGLTGFIALLYQEDG